MSTAGSKYQHFESEAAGMAAERNCESVVVDFTVAFDLGDVERMAQLFAEDGLWERRDGEIAGVAQLRHFMATLPPGMVVRHLLSNLRTSALSPTNAVIESYVTVLRHDFPEQPNMPAPLNGVNLMGRFRDELRLGQHGWQLVQRAVVVDFLQK